MNVSSGSVTISNSYNYLFTGDTITLDLSNVAAAAQTVTLTSTGIDTINLNDTVFTNYWIADVPFENSFPNWDDFRSMCKEYPGLEQAYEKLKTFYDLCRDDWEHKKKEQK